MLTKQLKTIALSCAVAVAVVPLFADELTARELKAAEKIIAKTEDIITRDADKPQRVIKALFDRAETYERINEPEKAREDYEKIISTTGVTNKQLIDAQLKFIELCYELEDPQTAAPVVQKILDNPDAPKKAQREAERMRTVHGKAPREANNNDKDPLEAMIEQGRQLMGQNEYDKAMTFLQGVIDDPKVTPDMKFNAHWFHANCYYLQEQYDKAIEEYTAMINNPAFDSQKKDQTRLHRAMCYDFINNYDQMLQDLNYLIEHKSSNIQTAYFDRGIYYKRKQKWDQAINDFNSALVSTDHPESKATYTRHRGETYFAMKDYDKALNDFNAVLSMNDIMDLQKMISLLDRAELHLELKDISLAKNDYSAVLPMNKRWDHLIVNAHRGLAKINEMQGDDHAAIKDYTAIIEMEPPIDSWQKSGAYMDRAQLYLKQRNIDAAVSDLSQIEKMSNVRPELKNMASGMLEKIKKGT